MYRTVLQREGLLLMLQVKLEGLTMEREVMRGQERLAFRDEKATLTLEA